MLDILDWPQLWGHNKMICLNDTDVLEAWSGTNNVIDCDISGMVGTIFTRLYTGTLGNAANVVVYTATEATAIFSMKFTNTDAAAATVNLKIDPADGGNDKFILSVAVSLEAGYCLAYDGSKFSVMDTSGRVITSVAVSDLAYGAGWNGITDTAASKNAIYDQMELRAPKASPTFTGVVTAPTIDLTGGQIAFPAAAVPSADPNTIDDYEKGFYTPVITGSTSGGFGLAASQFYYYTKIGNVVTLFGSIHITSEAACVGTIQVSLPFPTNAAGDLTLPCYLINTGGTNVNPGLYCGVGVMVGQLYQYPDNGTQIAITNTTVDTDWFLNLMGLYRV